MALLNELIGISRLRKRLHVDTYRLSHTHMHARDLTAGVPDCLSHSPLMCLIDLDGPLVVLIPDTADGGPPGVTLNLRPPGCSHGLPGGSVCDQAAGMRDGLGIVTWLVEMPCRFKAALMTEWQALWDDCSTRHQLVGGV